MKLFLAPRGKRRTPLRRLILQLYRQKLIKMIKMLLPEFLPEPELSASLLFLGADAGYQSPTQSISKCSCYLINRSVASWGRNTFLLCERNKHGQRRFTSMFQCELQNPPRVSRTCYCAVSWWGLLVHFRRGQEVYKVEKPVKRF